MKPQDEGSVLVFFHFGACPALQGKIGHADVESHSVEFLSSGDYKLRATWTSKVGKTIVGEPLREPANPSGTERCSI